MFLHFACFSFFPLQLDDPNLESVNILLFRTFRFLVSDLFSFVLSEFPPWPPGIGAWNRRGSGAALGRLTRADTALFAPRPTYGR